MKKLKLFVLALFTIILLTGCGSTKNLMCSSTKDFNGVTLEQRAEIEFKNDKPISIKMILDYKAENDPAKEQWSVLKDILGEAYNNKELSGIKINSKNGANKYEFTATVEVNFGKAKDEDLSKYSLSGINIANRDSSYDEVIKEAGDSGFTCK